MNTEFITTAAAFLIGGAGGYLIGWRTKIDKAYDRALHDFRQAEANLKRIQMERNNRTTRRRDDAAPGSSKVHKIRTRRPR